MTQEPNAEQRIFAEAIELPSDTERAVFLQEACGGNDALRRSVEALLRAYFAEENFIAPQVPDDVEREDALLIEAPGTVIGRYKLLEQIGEGGFGVVYVVEQQEPVRRKVALKIIKLGMDTRQVIARFEAERQALALMDHPHIAKVLDGGMTEGASQISNLQSRIPAGRPYFVMELVRGIPITEFCEENRLTLRERLELFLRVCQAIQHAHQKGVIHRDIKPSNVLVTMNDGVPHPMVIDFGVAKAIAEPLTDKTLYTRFAQMIGTPAYMSPEQAEMSNRDVDTRSDVYSLGILLYELLTGTTPFPEDRLREAGFAEIQRIITQEEPQRPSTRLARTRLSDPRPPLAARTHHSRFAADLDWIVLKAIDKDRTRRYETANGLANDIRRYLANEPVTAKPPSTAYRLSKFVQRNRVSVFAGAAVAVTLILATIISLTLAFRAIRAERGMSEEKERTAQEARRARQNLYFAEIKLANQALEDQNPGHALKLLEQHIPANAAAEDFRGWEWHYLWSQVRPDPAIELGTHETVIRSVAFSPSGELAASSDYAGGISVWEVETRRRLYYGKATAIVHDVLFFSENVLLAGDGSGTLTFHDVRKGEIVRVVELPATVRAVALSPRRRQLAVLTGDPDNVAETFVWTLAPASPEQPVATLTPALTLEGQNSASWPYIAGALTYSPSGNELAVGAGNGIVRIYDAGTGKLQEELDLKVGRTEGRVASLSYSPDGRWLASDAGQQGQDKSVVIVWKTSGWTVATVLTGHERGAREITFSPDGKSLLVASGDQTLRQWSVTDWTSEWRFLGHHNSVNAVAVDPSGQCVLTGGGDRRLLLRDLRRPSARLEPLVLPQLRHFEFSPSGLLAAIEANEVDPNVRNVVLREAPEFRVRTNLTLLDDHVTDVAFSSDSSLLAALSPDAVQVWDCRAERVVAKGALPDSNSRVIAGFAAEGKDLLLVDEDLRVLVWSVEQESIQDTWSAAEAAPPSPGAFDKRNLAFHPASSTLALGGIGSASVWDTASHTCRGRVGRHGIWDVEPAISTDGELLATLGRGGDKQVRLWDSRTFEPAGELDTPIHPICGLALLRNQGRLAVGRYQSGHIGIYDSETGIEILGVPPALTGVTLRCQWSPDGTVFAVVGTGGGILWRTTPGPAAKTQF